MADVIRFGAETPIAPGTPVLVGFPSDEGVRRNGGRVGAALAPDKIRRFFHRLVALELEQTTSPIDLGNLDVSGDLERDQLHLGEIVRDLLLQQAVPIVLGGGHETAFGTYLGYALAGRSVSIVNLDAHLDVRPTLDGLGHSGSPFRQAMEYEIPLPGANYACLGAQPFAVSAEHLRYVRDRGGQVYWRDEVAGRLVEKFSQRIEEAISVHLSIDADVVTTADVPGVSAPNPVGLPGVEVCACLFAAGASARIGSLELVEINPCFDHDDRSSRWAAVAIWQFLAGRARSKSL